MKNKQYEIIKKENSYWIKDEFSTLNGPYNTIDEAKEDVPKGDLQYPLELN